MDNQPLLRAQYFRIAGLSFLGGAILLGLLATVQMWFIREAFSVRSYFLPVLFGGIFGLMIGTWRLTLSLSRKRLDDLLRNIPIGILQTTRGGKIQSANPALAAMLGYESANEVMRIPTPNLFHDPERWQALLKKLGTDGVVSNFAAQLRKEDGSLIWAALDIRSTVNERTSVEILDGTVANITDRVIAEIARAEAGQHLQTIITQAPIGIASIGMDGRVNEINPAGLEILGSAGRDATIGLNVLTLQPLVEVGISEYFRKAIEDGSNFEFETRYTSLWGKTSQLRVLIAPQFNPKGKQIGVLNILEDINERHRSHLAIRQLNQDLENAYDETLRGWAHALELRDHETEGHSRRVVALTLNLARALKVPEEDLPHIRRGALLHDIGKFGIPEDLLFKTEELTAEEWEVMKRHPQDAYELLSGIRFLEPALDIPLCHHERWDGSGYPRGLKGEEIPLTARIFAVADVWDALCSDRFYRKSWSDARAREYLREQAGKSFDPRVVDAFLEIV